MDLKNFISNTLTQIAEGVQEAIDNSKERGYLVNPSVSSKNSNGCTVHFDLSVESETDGGVSIKILNGNVSEKSANRITFDIEMTLPSSGGVKPTKRPVFDAP